jgi:hypothetical protein
MYVYEADGRESEQKFNWPLKSVEQTGHTSVLEKLYLKAYAHLSERWPVFGIKQCN